MADAMRTVPEEDSEEEDDSFGQDEIIEEEDINPDDYERRICIAVDGSPLSEMAFRDYIDNMHKEGSLVIFVHAFELSFLQSFRSIMKDDLYVSPESWQNSLRRQADSAFMLQQRLTKIMKKMQIPCMFVGEGGRPGHVICEAAERFKADLIVIGSRGLGKVKRVLLGSVSTYVMHNAACAVAISRPKNRMHLTSLDSPKHGRRRIMSETEKRRLGWDSLDEDAPPKNDPVSLDRRHSDGAVEAAEFQDNRRQAAFDYKHHSQIRNKDLPSKENQVTINE